MRLKTLLLSVVQQEAESKKSLSLWAAVSHKSKLYKLPGIPLAILAVTFNEAVRTLQTGRETTKYRLPNHLDVEMRFSIPGRSEDKFSGFLLEDPWSLPHHDAFFVITSHPKEHFGQHANEPDQWDATRYNVHFTPHYKSFTTKSAL